MLELEVPVELIGVVIRVGKSLNLTYLKNGFCGVSLNIFSVDYNLNNPVPYFLANVVTSNSN